MSGRVHVAQTLKPAGPGVAVPLCWYAEEVERGGAGDDEWLVSLDHEAIREEPDDLPGSFRLARDTLEPTCTDCLEWAHA